MSRHLSNAQRKDNDEYYTGRETAVEFIDSISSALFGKSVYCNCDEYDKSEIVKELKRRFEELRLKKLVATSYTGKQYYEYNGECETIYDLEGDGSYDSEECIKIALENDVIVTNPPFSHISNRLYDFVKNNNLKFAYIMPHCSLGYSKWLKEYNERKIKYIKMINRIFITPENKRVELGTLVCNNLGIDKYSARKKDTKRTYKDLKIEDEIIRCYDSSQVIGSLDALPDKFLAPITTMLCRQDLLEKYEVSLYNQLKKYYPKIFRRVLYTKREKKA